MTVDVQILPNPSLLSWQSWADTVVGFNPGLQMEVSPDDDWREFARRLSQVVPEAPQADPFDSWQAWASALKGVLHV